MLHIYPVTQTSLNDTRYTVKANGLEVPLQFARVSKEPFNRRWPGHQRQIEQSEIVPFVMMSSDEPVTFEVTSDQELSNAVIRPCTLGVTQEIDGNTARFTVDGGSYCTFEPAGRHHAIHIFIDKPRRYDVNPADANVIYFGKGVHEAGMIELKDGQTLFIDEGAVVFACVKAMDANNIRIIGHGILDNSHNRETILFEANEKNNNAAVNNAVRLHTVQLEYCTNVVIDGITIRDSLVYNIRPIGCRNVAISNVKIIGCWRYNSDGIDMHNCENVVIDHCFLRTYDDAICIKGFDCYYEGDVEKAVQEAMHHNGGSYENFRHVLVRDCVIWNDWGKGLEIGAETRAEEICGIFFENCSIIHVLGPVLDCCNVDYARVHHVTWRDISVEYDDVIPPPLIQKNDDETYAIHITDYNPPLCMATVEFHHEYSTGGVQRGVNDHLVFENIRLFSNKKPVFVFRGYDEKHAVHDVVLKNITWNGVAIHESGEYGLATNEFCRNVTIE